MSAEGGGLAALVHVKFCYSRCLVVLVVCYHSVNKSLLLGYDCLIDLVIPRY